MRTLRLIDPDGYTVPDGVRENIPDEQAEQVTNLLKTTVATEHAARWGYTPPDYQVQDTPVPTFAFACFS